MKLLNPLNTMFQKIVKTDRLISTVLIRILVGTVFLSEGIQKFLFPSILGAGRFEKLGFANPEFWASFTGYFEIICGSLILLGLLTRLATIPLLITMIVAFITTKYPILLEKGFWSMVHEYRTDFAMTLGNIFLLIKGAGRWSIDNAMGDKEQLRKVK
jgi:putative oxidoreductase